MYKPKIWDEDKLDIHSSSYNSKKYSSSPPGDKKDKEYHEQKYGSKDKNPSSDYMKREEREEKEEKKDELFEDVEKEKKEDANLTEEEIPLKAAKEIFEESKREAKKPAKKDINSIEDAIKKAIEQEKKVIVMDN